jgi:predicted PurR-regulated permease PerM
MTTTSTSATKKLIILVFILVLLYFGKDFLMPLAIGGILATLFLPICKWLEGKGIYKGIAGLACLILLLIVIVSAIGLLGWKISELTNDYALIKQKTIETADRVQEYIFNHLGISVEKQSQILKDEQPSIAGIMQKVAGSFSYILTNFILVLAYFFLLLYYRIHLQHFILKLTGHSNREQMLRTVYSVTRVSQQYLIGLTKMIICLWIMYSIGFSILGVKNAIFFAILCGLLEIVPFVGNITGTTLTVLVSALQGASLTMMGGIVITYTIVQFIQGWVLEPLIVGHQVKINPLFTIIALVIGELIWGIAGIFLAIPLLAMCKTVCDHVESLKPYGFLIGEIENKKNEFGIIEKVKSIYKKP